MSDDEKTVSNIIDEQLRTQGVAVTTVQDGHVFTFTEEVLEALLARARVKGGITLFIHTGACA